MRYIQKGIPPQFFEEWKQRENEDWRPSWGNLRNPEKSNLKEVLLEEQGYICCYCGGRITNDHNTEIEHVKPRSECSEEEKINYYNLLASCSGGRKDTTPRELSCNAKRGDKPLSITPLNTECDYKFLYTLDGQVIPKEIGDKECNDDINNLGQNVERLKNRRDALLKVYNSFNKEQASKIISHLSSKNNNEGYFMYKELHYVVICFLKNKFSI